MLEKPNLDDLKLLICLRDKFGLGIEKITFLPIGADQNTAVYRASAKDGKEYFVKLRSGNFVRASIEIPKYLSELGIQQVIPALTTRSGQLWTDLDRYKVILYPYVEGQNGFEANMSAQHWIEFGGALKHFHTAQFPSEITACIPRESFSPRYREIVRSKLALIDERVFEDPVAAEMAAYLRTKRAVTLELVERAERFALALLQGPPKFILCHGDIHGWNLHIDNHGAIHMVDWDTLIHAPKERDLMFAGSGLGESGFSPQEEETLFYRGYGPTDIHRKAIAYYRCERIIEDFAIYCEQILSSKQGGQDRIQSLEYLKSNYRPGGTIEVAQKSHWAPNTL